MKVNPRDSANLNVRRGWTDSCCQGNGHIFVDRGQMTRVLIADDAGDQRALYVAPLALAGFVVDEAADGGEVIDIVARQQPDAIVLDLVMPVLDASRRTIARQRSPSSSSPATRCQECARPSTVPAPTPS